MKKILFLGISAFLLMLPTNMMAQFRVVASNNIVTRDVQINDYDAIEVQGSPYVVYTQDQGMKAKLTISASDNLIDLLSCEVEGNKLIVKMKDKTGVAIKRKEQLMVVTSSSDLSRVALNGSGDIRIKDKVTTDNLQIVLKGSGDIKIDDIDCKFSASINLNGSGDIDVNGVIAPQSNISLQGSGDLEVNSLNGSSAQVSLNGSGDLSIKKASVVDGISAHLKSSGDLEIYGIKTHSVDATVVGSGDLVLKGEAEIAQLRVQGSGDLQARNLEARKVVVNVAGSGDITCWSTEVLDTTISSSGDVAYQGNPSQVFQKGKRKARQL